jgi:transcriptional regulator with XRE-family HTH domain
MGGKGSGSRPDTQRRRRAAELRARGLTFAEIGRKMGCTRQAAHQLLRQPRAQPPRTPPPLACAGCGAALGPAPGQRDYDPPLCLPCLAKRPRAPFGQRLRAHRIARGLSRAVLGRKAGVGEGTVTVLERGKNRPQPGTLRRLA